MNGTSRMGLTVRQADCLAVIEAGIARDGVSPTYDAIADALGLRGKSAVPGLIERLEAKGRIRRLPNLAQSIEIVAAPRPVACPVQRPAGSKSAGKACLIEELWFHAELSLSGLFHERGAALARANCGGLADYWGWNALILHRRGLIAAADASWKYYARLMAESAGGA